MPKQHGYPSNKQAGSKKAKAVNKTYHRVRRMAVPKKTGKVM